MSILGKDEDAAGYRPGPLCKVRNTGQGKTPGPIGREVLAQNGAGGRTQGEDRTQGESRKLTLGEVRLAQSVFGDRIKYDKVAVFHKQFIFFQPKDRLMTPNGNIYSHRAGNNYSEDYSKISEPALDQSPLVYTQAEFIHEMTHVWQRQTGRWVEIDGIFERNYDYDFATLGKKDFKSYGIEEEAQMVEDYYILLHGSQIFRNGDYVKDPPSIESYKNALKKYFPLSQ